MREKDKWRLFKGFGIICICFVVYKVYVTEQKIKNVGKNGKVGIARIASIKKDHRGYHVYRVSYTVNNVKYKNTLRLDYDLKDIYMNKGDYVYIMYMVDNPSISYDIGYLEDKGYLKEKEMIDLIVDSLDRIYFPNSPSLIPTDPHLER